MKFIWIILIAYLLYKLVFEFLLPVSKVTSQVRSKIKEMKEQQQNQHAQQSNKKPPEPINREGDYIDFEEVK